MDRAHAVRVTLVEPFPTLKNIQDPKWRALMAGLGILNLAFVELHTPRGYIGLVPLVTGLIGWCPAYLPFGVKTCKTG